MINHRSEQLGELFGALAKAQSEMGVATLNASNPHFKSKFSDLTELVRVSRPALTKNGLAVLQLVLPDFNGELYLYTSLGHSSNQYIETRIRMVPDKDGMQGLGGCISYLKRYTYAALVGVVSSGDDYDGENFIESSRGPITSQLPNALSGGTELITKEQLEQLDHELKSHPDIVASILERFTPKIKSLKDIPKASFMTVLTRSREIIKTKGQ